MQIVKLLHLVVMSIVLMKSSVILQAEPWHSEKGYASYYGKGFAGRPTANGEIFSPREMTAAHRRLPLGTKVMVENPETGQQVEVKINDRGPYVEKKRRIIDLSRTAAESLGMIEKGVHPVKITVTEPPSKEKRAERDYEIQIATFTKHQEARKVLAEFRKKRYPTFIEVRQGPAGKYYRVRAGPFETRTQAREIAQKLQQQGHAIFLDEVANTN